MSYSFDIKETMQAAGDAAKEYDRILEQDLDLAGIHIDEIAVLFQDPHNFDKFTKEAVRMDGCILFNTAEDHVHTMPMKTCYTVDYRFFTVPVQFLGETFSEMRIEAMMIQGGASPLHYAELWNVRDAPAFVSPLVHASFKCVNEEQYAAVCHRLRTKGWEAAQRCESTYGKFSYWSPLEDEKYPDRPPVYLKPRVNTRDEL